MARLPALATCLVLAACSSVHNGGPLIGGTSAPTPATPTTAPARVPTAAATSPGPRPVPKTAAAGVTSCSSYATPDAHRPVVTAEVTVTGAKVTGTERVVFTPDLAVTELVFRLWASSPRPTKARGSSALTSVRVNGTSTPSTRPAPTLVRIAFSGAAGTPITIDLGFTITLPTGADDRYGHQGTTSWFASGIPLLAWERGRGWATEPATANFAEASTSEEMQLARLTVHHAKGLSVIATGKVIASSSTTSISTAPTVRDLAVSVGAFRRVSVQGPVRVTVGVAPQVGDDPGAVAKEVVRAMRAHVARFGPFPYEQLNLAVLPDIRGGIEYPGAILLGTKQIKDATASHEVAHEWFYGLVGDDQARDPWLDEGFATYAEALDRGTSSKYLRATVPADGKGRAGRPMTYWEGRASYYRSVYVQTAAALLRARAAAPKAFDAQVRCYVARHAHRIATPHDVAASIPLAVAQLRKAGAL